MTCEKRVELVVLGYIRDEILPNSVGINSFINRDIRIPIKQTGFNRKYEGSFSWGLFVTFQGLYMFVKLQGGGNYLLEDYMDLHPRYLT